MMFRMTSVILTRQGLGNCDVSIGNLKKIIEKKFGNMLILNGEEYFPPKKEDCVPY